MAAIEKFWAGRIFGTNTGKIFLEIAGEDGVLVGLLRVADDQYGLSTYEIAGSFEEGLLSLNGTPKDSPPDIETGRVTATARLQQDGSLRGEWKSEIGTAGAFELYPHLGSQPNNVLPGPSQLYTAVRDLGVLRLDTSKNPSRLRL